MSQNHERRKAKTGSKEVEVAFLFADLSGYTAMTEAHGGKHAAEAVTRYVGIAQANLEAGARIVQRVGDEVLIVAEEIEAAVETALRLRAAIELEPLFPTARAGLHAGKVIETSEGYFGAALNLAARVADYARGGQILCTQPIADVAMKVPGIEVSPLGAIRFKNVAQHVPVFMIEDSRSAERMSAIDPVCRMQVRQEFALARLPFKGTCYYFCSFECAQRFTASPETFVG
jgi:class 3 adenylate cyclase